MKDQLRFAVALGALTVIALACAVAHAADGKPDLIPLSMEKQRTGARKAGWVNAGKGQATQEPSDGQRMFYMPDPARSGYLWDVWVHQHQGRYYLYYIGSLGQDSRAGDNISLAISEDGIHWKEEGIVVPMSRDGIIVGSCGIWEYTGKEALPRFVMNLMEGTKSRSQIMFSLGSDDLLRWKHLGEKYVFGPDPRWYDAKRRWVGISVVPASQGGYHGYWTASPQVGYKHLFGFGHSPDGVTWEVLPPPEVEGIGPGAPREIGGSALIGGKYYLLFCTCQGEMQVLVSDKAEGPFRVQEKNVRFLFGQTHFARFASGTDRPLVVHHLMAPSGLDTQPDCYFAPIKAVDIDKEGIMRLAYWEGNDRLKSRELEVNIAGRKGGGGRLVMFDNRFDTDRGLVLEGRFADMKPGRFLSLDQGLFIETDAASGSGVGIMIKPFGITQIGTMKGDASGFRMDSFIDRQAGYGANPRFRLLLKGSLFEFYLNDLLVQSYAMPDEATGRIGYIHHGNPESVGDFKAWN